MMLFFLITTLIFLSYYLLLTRLKLQSVSEKLISIILLASAQIVLSELLLGIAGLLSIKYLTALNLLISTCLLVFGLNKKDSIRTNLSNDSRVMSNFLKSLHSSYIVLLFILFCFVCFWLFISAFLLPPRGIDDLTYHLPPIYEYIQQQKIFLLPVEYRGHFAFPLNAELLFAWPLIFFKNTIPIGFVQLFYAVTGIIVVYALCRQMKLKKDTSVLAGFLFFFSPVVLAQSGVAYIDIVVSVFFLISLLFSIRFYFTQKPSYLYLAGISMGLMVGMKYTMLLSALVLQILIFIRFSKENKKQYAGYAILILCFSGYWYIRNIFVVGHPFYPFNVAGLESTYTSLGDLSLVNIVNKYFYILKLFFTKDSGLGSFNGGYGIVFWGLAFPSWIYVFIKSIRSKAQDKLVGLIVWAQIFVGFAFFMIVPLDQFYLYPRFSIFMIAICLIAFGKVLDSFDKYIVYRHVLIFCCCIFSFLATFQLARAKLPTYSVDIPIHDITTDKDFSKMRYLRVASTSTSFLWETLDYITLDYGKGLDCYFASSLPEYIGPIYGSNLQNRIWNFKEDKSHPPDALGFLIHDEQKMKYYGGKITIDEVINNKDYLMIDIAEKAYLYLNKLHIKNKSVIKQFLIRHYENYYENEIKVAAVLKNKLTKDYPVIASDYYGMGLQYLYMTSKINNSVHMLPRGKETEFIKNRNFNNFYSINKTYDGYNAKQVYEIRINKTEKVKLFYNSKK